MRNVSLTLFYLLLLLLPTQLGRHFFFDFSLISGIRSDYLAPTIYFTDVIIFFIIFFAFFEYKILSASRRIEFRIFLIAIFYLLFNIFFVASNTWVAFYKLLKIIEFVFLGIIIVKIKPKISSVVYALSIAAFYSSVIAIFQFWQQRSIGGLLYWLGERSFNAASPGIAATSMRGALFLRPYATFPHPNVLGGFLAVVLPLIFFTLIYEKKIWLSIVSLLGFSALFLSFSRASWLVTALGLIFVVFLRKVKKSVIFLAFFYFLVVLSVIFPLIFRFNIDNWSERATLLEGALKIASDKPLFGVGMNNSIMVMRDYVSSNGLYIYQPVHNIYMLILTELGIVGAIFLLLFFLLLYKRFLLSSPLMVIALIQLAVLGMFDHYLITLQQGQLLLTVFVSLAFLRQKNYA